MNTADATDAHAVVAVTLTPEQARHVARIVWSDVAELCETGQRNFEHMSMSDAADARDELENLEASIAIERERLEALAWGDPETPVTVEWHRYYAEKIARRLLDEGASKMSDVRMGSDTPAAAYRAAMREAEAGAAILDQLEATR